MKLLLAVLLALPAVAEKIEIRLDQELARPAGVVLRGTSPWQTVMFTLPHDRAVGAAHLSLRLRHAAGLLGSSFAVSVNGTPLGSLRLDAGASQIEADIPTEALGDFNRLEFQAVLHNTGAQCESPSDPTLWVEVAAATRMTFDIAGYKHAPTAEDFPVPLADPLDYRPSAIRFVLTPAQTSADYALAAHIAGALGDRLEYRSARITAASTYDAAADASQVLIGTPAEIAALTGVAVPALDAGAGRLRVVENNARPGRYLLLVEGADIVARRKAVGAIADTARLRGVLPESETFRLSDIATLISHDATGPGITVEGEDPPAISVSLTPAAGEHFVRAEQTVRIEYAYGPRVDNANSALEVLLNGKIVRGQALERPAGSGAELLEVFLPADALGEHNVLEMRFRLFPKNGGSCVAPGSTGGGQLWATLLGTSTFHLPRDSYADLPDLAALRHGGYPLQNTPSMMVARPADATLLLNAAFLLGRLGGGAPQEVRFDSEMTDDFRREYNLIAVSASPQIKLEETLSPWNPLRVLLTIHAPPDNPGALADPTLIARLSGAITTMDTANHIRTVRAARTQRFGGIPLNRRVKYWVMDNVAWMIANSLLFLFAGFFFLRYLRRNYFPPIDETTAEKI